MLLPPQDRYIAPGVQDRPRQRQETRGKKTVLGLQRHEHVEQDENRDRRREASDPEGRKTDRYIRIDLAALAVDSCVGDPVTPAERHEPDGKESYEAGLFFDREVVGQRAPVRVVRQLRRRELVFLSQRVDRLLSRIFQGLPAIDLSIHIRNVRVSARQIDRVKILRLLHVKRRDLFRQSVVERGRRVVSHVAEIGVKTAVDPAVFADAVGAVHLGPFSVDRRIAVQAEIEDPVRHVQRPELPLAGSAPEFARRVERSLGELIESPDALIPGHAERNDLLRRVNALYPRLKHIGGAAVAAVGSRVHIRRVHLTAALRTGEDFRVDHLLLAGHCLPEPLVGRIVVRTAVFTEQPPLIDIICQVGTASRACQHRDLLLSIVKLVSKYYYIPDA